MANIIRSDTCFSAWVDVFEHLSLQENKDDTNLLVQINDPTDFSGIDTWLTDYDPEKYAPGKGKVRHVVNTIFPFRLKSYFPNREDFYRKYVSIFNSSTAYKNWGTYFQRLISFGRECQPQGINQLERAIQALQGGSPQKYFITFHITAANIESNVRPLGGPCWQYGELIINELGALDLVAVYRNHDYYCKALGNFIGLAKLLNFICTESGKRPGRLIIHAIHAYSSQPMSKLTRLINR
ncbi:hypothetical protein [Flaviaesturariibacter amylovorans]|uniref:hypothetical protein n=1 Tax=Flaviaesturariibacter amylovorans TaxID=1084520 RepID=UPI0031EE7932